MRLSISSESMRQELQREWENRPRDPHPDPGIFTGFGDEIVNFIPRAGGKLVSPFYGDASPLRRTDPNEMGIAAHLVEGSSDLAPYGAVWLAAHLAGNVLSWVPTLPTKVAGLALKTLPYVVGGIYAGYSKWSESSKLHQYQSVDKETADKLGLAEAVTFVAATQVVPPIFQFKSVIASSLSGSGINIAFGAVDRGIASHILEQNGYHEMAEHHKIFDMQSMTLDGLIGGLVGLMHTKEGRAFAKKHASQMGTHIRDTVDGILDRYIYKHVNTESSFGIQKTFEGHDAHKTKLAKSIDGLLKGEKTNFTKVDEELNTILSGILDAPKTGMVFEVEPKEPHLQTSTPVEFSDLKQGKAHTPEKIDQLNAEKVLKKFEEERPEAFQELHEHTKEDLNFNKLVQEKNLFQVAIDCFMKLGGV